MSVLIGQTTAGTTSDFFGDGNSAAWPFVASASGALATIFGQTKVTNANAISAKLGIYSDTAGAPNVLLGSAVGSPVPTGTGLFSADLSAAGVTIISGTTYWLAMMIDTSPSTNITIQGTVTAGGRELVGQMTAPANPGGGMNVFPVIWGESVSAAPSVDPSVLWNELGPSAEFGPDPFNEALAPAVSSPQASVLAGLGSAQAFGAITAVGGPVSVVVAGLGSAAQFGAIKTNIAFSVVGLGSAQQFGLISLKFQVPSLASAAAFGVPQENIAFFVAGLGSAQAFGTATASLGGTNQNVSATGLATAQAFGTPTPSPGGVTVTVTGLGSAKAFGVLQENIRFSVTGLGSAQAFGTITFTTGGVTISVTGLGSAQAFGFPTVTTPGGGPSFDPAIHGGRHR